ncbi:Maleamate amidohydrolase [Variovorax sp. PBS-H4]|uniref:isochorismatase family protein n=1 Tax=Variovorax sp. PBS-H4 TaxID=434008 RepID=UPI001317590F|nr:isochorismatase family protein [Variovorax sp. PBS-H4]VTU37684.1 Maleamate amidohydrolase [Variovorax sp. PBS-H4]
MTHDVYERQGFGAALLPQPPFGLLVVDFVNGFVDPDRFGGGNCAEAADRVQELLRQARARRWPVAHSRIVFQDDGADANVFAAKVPRLLGLTERAPASAIIDALTPAAGELVVRKTVPSAFFGTGLAAWLAGRGVRTLLVAGATTSGCVRASVVDAMSWGFRPIVVTDCVGDRSLQAHESSLFDMGQKYATALPRDDFLDALLKA